MQHLPFTLRATAKVLKQVPMHAHWALGVLVNPRSSLQMPPQPAPPPPDPPHLTNTLPACFDLEAVEARRRCKNPVQAGQLFACRRDSPAEHFLNRSSLALSIFSLNTSLEEIQRACRKRGPTDRHETLSHNCLSDATYYTAHKMTRSEQTTLNKSMQALANPELFDNQASERCPQGHKAGT